MSKSNSIETKIENRSSRDKQYIKQPITNFLESYREFDPTYEPGRSYHAFLTQDYEYLICDDRCVGVKDRSSGRWCGTHLAQRSLVLGSIHPTGKSQPVGAYLLRPGEYLWLHTFQFQIITDPVIAIEQPSVDSIKQSFRELKWDKSASRLKIIPPLPRRKV